MQRARNFKQGERGMKTTRCLFRVRAPFIIRGGYMGTEQINWGALIRRSKGEGELCKTREKIASLEKDH